MRIYTLSAGKIVELNRRICLQHRHRHQLYDIGKVESALHVACYPGSAPFQHGGIATIAGAMAFYLVQAHAFFDGNKRTAVAASLVFLDANGLELIYPKDPVDKLAQLVEACASGSESKEDLMKWYDTHKRSLP